MELDILVNLETSFILFLEILNLNTDYFKFQYHDNNAYSKFWLI